jgi:RNA polymerase sigma factor (sigma-70 family)
MHLYSIDKGIEDGEGGEMTIDIKSDDLDPEEEIIREQKIKLMREVVDKLKPRYRELIELRYFKEFSYEEIAEQMELPIGTVKAQLFRARELLFGILKKSRDRI